MQGLYCIIRDMFSIFRQFLLTYWTSMVTSISWPSSSHLNNLIEWILLLPSISPSNFRRYSGRSLLGQMSTNEQILVAKVDRKHGLASLGHMPPPGGGTEHHNWQPISITWNWGEAFLQRTRRRDDKTCWTDNMATVFHYKGMRASSQKCEWGAKQEEALLWTLKH